MKLGRQRNDHKGRAAIRHYANQPEIFTNLRRAFVSSSSVDSMHGPRQSGQPAMAISSPRNLSDSLLEITET